MKVLIEYPKKGKDIVKVSSTWIDLMDMDQTIAAVDDSFDEQSEVTISIVTTDKYIICRAWEWDKTSQSEIQRLKKELLLLKLVSERDQKQPLFLSKYSLPNELKLWLTQHEVPFEED